METYSKNYRFPNEKKRRDKSYCAVNPHNMPSNRRPPIRRDTAGEVDKHESTQSPTMSNIIETQLTEIHQIDRTYDKNLIFGEICCYTAPNPEAAKILNF